MQVFINLITFDFNVLITRIAQIVIFAWKQILCRLLKMTLLK